MKLKFVTLKELFDLFDKYAEQTMRYEEACQKQEGDEWELEILNELGETPIGIICEE